MSSIEKVGIRILSWIDHGFMIVPTKEEIENLKEWNPRIYSQEGVFFVQGNKITGGRNRGNYSLPFITITNELSDIPSTISASPHVRKIKIPKEDKKALLQVLDSKGINKKSLYLG